MPAFAEWVRLAPGRLAVSGFGEAMTYSELDHASRRLASRFSTEHRPKTDMVHDGLVGFVGPVSLDCVVAVMAAHRVAVGFVFLDMAQPLHALVQLARHAQISLLVAARSAEPLTSELGQASDLPVLTFSGIWPTTDPEIAAPLTDRERDGLADHQLSHIRYTSGSTGQPKGVAISRNSLCWALTRLRPTVETRPEDRFGLFGHFWPLIIFEALRGGASLHAFDPARLGPRSLADKITSESITVMATYAALFGQLVNVPEVEFPSLRLAHISGEPLSADQVLRFESACPNAVLVNSYGSSEFPLIAYYRHRRGSLGTKDTVPAGVVFKKAEVAIVDERQASLPPGEIGEIIVTSPYVPSGYHRDVARSTRTFSAVSDGCRQYRTGDLGYFDSTGCLFLAGRADDQIKIGGQAVRPAQLEQLILGFDEVSQCVVVAIGQAPESQRMACHYVPTIKPGSSALSPQDLRLRLRQKMPRYMVPSYFVEHTDLPRKATGKPDRAMIKQLPLTDVTAVTAVGTNPDELLVLKAWQHVLGHSNFDHQVEFLDAGGTSLDAMTMLTRLEKLSGIRLPFENLWLEGTSIPAIARQLRQARDSGLAGMLVPISPTSKTILPTKPHDALIAAHLLEGDLSDYFDLAGHLSDSYSVLGFYPNGMDGLVAPGFSIDALACHGRDLVQEIYPSGPYRLIGFSFGALVAFELARALGEAGKPVDQLVLIDPSVEWSDPLMHVRIVWTAIKSGKWQDLFAYFAGRLNPLRTLRDAHLTAFSRYQPAPLTHVKTLLVLSADDKSLDLRQQLWKAFLPPGTQTMVAEGDHHSMLREPHAATLAVKIREWLG